jgi:sugar phosphate permease
VFTAATGAAVNLSSMVIVRFLFGAGEAGAWPMAARAFSAWIPRFERATVQGIFFAGAHLVGGLTPLLIAFMLLHMSWRMVFVTFGLLGLIFIAAWLKWFKNDPSEHPEVSPAELAHILHGRPPDSKHTIGREYWGRLLFSRNVVLLCLAYLSNSTIFYFCISWLPTYLKNRHGFDATALGFLSGLPLLVSVPSDLFGGTLSDRLSAKYGMRVGRCFLGSVAYALCAAFLFVAASATSPMVAGRVDRHRHRPDHADAWRGVGHVHRNRAQSRGSGGRGHEHVGADRQHGDAAGRRLLRGVVQQLGLPDLHARLHVPGRRRLLVADRPS